MNMQSILSYYAKYYRFSVGELSGLRATLQTKTDQEKKAWFVAHNAQ